MRTSQYSTAALIDLSSADRRTLAEVMTALGTSARRTAFRSSSYSHREGDTNTGCRSFSVAGTLLASGAFRPGHGGCSKLVRRSRHCGQFLIAPPIGPQGAERPARSAGRPRVGRTDPDADLVPEELRAAIVLFASLLDERQRRLYAGLESLKCGWGGDTRIAGLLGIDSGTVARGRRQLLAASNASSPTRWRAAMKKKRVIAAIEAQLRRRHPRKHRSPRRSPAPLSIFRSVPGPWPVSSRTSTIAARQPQARLGRLRPGPRPAVHLHRLTARQVRRARPANRQHRCQKRDAGRLQERPGWALRRQRPRLPLPGDRHRPYGIYDGREPWLRATSHGSLQRRWWQREGCQRYRGWSSRQHLPAIAASSMPSRPAADPYQLTVTVCHYPSGASKWNPIDHRLFSEISKRWPSAGSYQTILNHIRIHCHRATGARRVGRRRARCVSDAEFDLSGPEKATQLLDLSTVLNRAHQNRAYRRDAPHRCTAMAMRRGTCVHAWRSARVVSGM